MTKRLLLVLVLFSLCNDLTAQNRYVVRFTDKTNTPYSISNPLAYLSQRAIDRRVNYGITIDQSDLPVDPAYIQQVAAISGVTILNHSKWFNSVTVDLTSASLLTNINALPFVQSSVHVGKALPPGGSTIDKFNQGGQGPLNHSLPAAQRVTGFNYGNASNQTTMININALHNLGFSGDGIIIAVLDAGFQDANLMTCFDSLFQQGRVLTTWDFVSNEANVYDNFWHGSSVLSTMAANVPGDMVGTAPHAQYILLRSEDENSENVIEEYNYASAAEFADSAGADVIHSSLGYTEFDDPTENHTYADMNGNTCPGTIAANKAAAKGIIVVSSAGNEGNSPWHYISCPADGFGVLAIGAVDASGMYASFSSQGPSFDGRVKPDVVAQGQGTTVYMPGNPTSTQSSGTSFSGPIIAGSIACLHQMFPAKTNAEIMYAVRQSASQYTTPDPTLGYGIPDFGVASLTLGGHELSGSSNDIELIDFYPNPLKSGSTFYVRFFSRLRESVRLDVLDVTGKIIESQMLDNSSTIMPFDLDTKISAGVYFIKASVANKSILKKLVVY